MILPMKSKLCSSSAYHKIGIADMLGSRTEGGGLMEGDWVIVGGELAGILDGFGDGITEMLGEALVNVIRSKYPE